jgi:hypothetical protein
VPLFCSRHFNLKPQTEQMAFQQQFHHHANHVEYNTLNAFHSPPLWNIIEATAHLQIVNGNEPKWALAIRTLNSINRKLSLSAIATAARCTHGVSVRRLTHIPGHSHACASRDDRSAMCVWNSYLKGVRSTAAALWMRVALTMRALWPPWMRQGQLPQAKKCSFLQSVMTTSRLLCV